MVLCEDSREHSKHENKEEQQGRQNVETCLSATLIELWVRGHCKFPDIANASQHYLL